MTNEDFYNDLPIGRDNAIPRSLLAVRWDMSEDSVRRRIAKLRAWDNGDDFVIVSSSTNGTLGYYKTDNAEERRAYMKETRSRAINTFKPLRKINRIEAAASNRQLRMDCNLRLYRTEAGLNNLEFIQQLADHGLHITPSLLALIETGQVLPQPYMAQVMAEVIGFPVADLFGAEYASIAEVS